MPRLFTLNPASVVPIYRQLVEQIRRMTSSGQLPPGSELPSVREISAEYLVNPTTVSKAYSLLEVEGLLQRNRGKPMTVAAGRSTQNGLSRRLKHLDELVVPLVIAARQLGLSETDLVRLIRKKMGEDA